jgi:hypothetical protein
VGCPLVCHHPLYPLPIPPQTLTPQQGYGFEGVWVRVELVIPMGYPCHSLFPPSLHSLPPCFFQHMNRKHEGQPAVTKGTVVPSYLSASLSPQDEFSSFYIFFFIQFFFESSISRPHDSCHHHSHHVHRNSNHHHDILSPPCHHLVPATYNRSATPPHPSHTRVRIPAFSSQSTMLTFSRAAVVLWPQLLAHCGPLCHATPCHMLPLLPTPPCHLGTPCHHSVQVPTTSHTTLPPHYTTPLWHESPHRTACYPHPHNLNRSKCG